MITIAFNPHNKLDGRFVKPIQEIIQEYNADPKSKMDLPFERKLLNFMADKYGGFGILTKEQWNEIYEQQQIQRGS